MMTRNSSFMVASLIVAVVCGLVLTPVIGTAQNLQLGLGLGTGVSYPDVTSFNLRVFGEMQLGKLLPMSLPSPLNSPFIQAEAEAASLFGIRLISTDFSLLLPVEVPNFGQVYFGGGGGLFIYQSSFGQASKVTYHGLMGIRTNIAAENLSLFIQGKIKNSPLPGSSMLTTVDLGALYYF